MNKREQEVDNKLREFVEWAFDKGWIQIAREVDNIRASHNGIRVYPRRK